MLQRRRRRRRMSSSPSPRSSLEPTMRSPGIRCRGRLQKPFQALKILEDEVGNIMRDREILVTRLMASKSHKPTRDSLLLYHPQPVNSSSSLSLHSNFSGGSGLPSSAKLSAAQAELQACEAQLAIKERDLALGRNRALREGLSVRCRAMVDCGWVWGEMGKEALRALEGLLMMQRSMVMDHRQARHPLGLVRNSSPALNLSGPQSRLRPLLHRALAVRVSNRPRSSPAHPVLVGGTQREGERVRLQCVRVPARIVPTARPDPCPACTRDIRCGSGADVRVRACCTTYAGQTRPRAAYNGGRVASCCLIGGGEGEGEGSSAGEEEPEGGLQVVENPRFAAKKERGRVRRRSRVIAQRLHVLQHPHLHHPRKRVLDPWVAWATCTSNHADTRVESESGKEGEEGIWIVTWVLRESEQDVWTPSA
ncbi:hypothetical protein Hypma_011181 [Hypsizygus marmoreus]|uniref:Uncharacterized protein n=1 Tax=Hypsizygus marmoreus TaxID=39966 RepID=A0A369JPU1_HYPMA|nr:hypothetical protein Hypma_011181 [Hypsizygus marmoreus]